MGRSTGSNPVIEVEGLRKEYDTPDGTETAVADLSLSVHDAEFVSLVGPSGCGKTTTLRCIAGLETPTAGTVRIDGRDVSDLPANERDLAMMFQDIALYPHMTNLENVAYPLKLRGIDPERRHRRAREVAETVRIDDMLDKSPDGLSGGQRQRVALARTVVQDPVAFLMDEPLSDLDAKLKTEMRKEIQRVHRRVEKPMLYVTHDQRQAMTMSDHVVVMRDGRIEQEGSPNAVYARPRNQFVASFVGKPAMNFLDATADTTAHGCIVEFDGLDARLLVPGEGADGAVTVGVRPQQVTVGPDAPLFEGTVRIVEPFGDRTVVTTGSPQGEVEAVVEDLDADVGDTVDVAFDPDDVHLFDAETGVRIARATEQAHS